MRTFKTAAFAATLALGLAACGSSVEETPSLSGASSPYAEQQAAIDFHNSARGQRALAQARAGQTYTPSDEERAADIAAAGY
jgi:hypothetical protein